MEQDRKSRVAAIIGRSARIAEIKSGKGPAWEDEWLELMRMVAKLPPEEQDEFLDWAWRRAMIERNRG
jgi:hypothetical protein